MNNILNKPFTDENYARFAINANDNGQRIIEYNDSFYALYPYEDLQDGNIVDLREDVEYIKQQRLLEIEEELKQADTDYENVLNTPYEYTNGYKYKPKYIEDSYVLLIAADVFPLTIWDASEINSVEMAKNDLIALSMFLKQIAEPAFQTRKNLRKTLLEEKNQLTNQ